MLKKEDCIVAAISLHKTTKGCKLKLNKVLWPLLQQSRSETDKTILLVTCQQTKSAAVVTALSLSGADKIVAGVTQHKIICSHRILKNDMCPYAFLCCLNFKLYNNSF